MFSISLNSCAFICATLILATTTLTTTTIRADEIYSNKPWPTYSLQNMPKTHFTCRDKILGGYYADPETQCQMFHVCVKLSGVGLQDYRFLCPNSTAFDQDLQICANWADVECDQNPHYDNFDLYHGNTAGYDNKRADEDESTFHLQRAESGDIRRSKETRQKTRPEQSTKYGKPFEAQQQQSTAAAAAAATATTRSANGYNTQTSKKPIVSFYTPTTSTTTERNNDDSKQDFDDIFKGSHSSHFFSNRNGGREDDFIDHPVKTKPNDFTDSNRKYAEPTKKSRILTNRGQTRSTTTTTASTTTTPTPATKITKKITVQTSFNADFLDYAQFYKSTSVSTTATPSTTPSSAVSTRLSQSNASRFGFSIADIQAQEKIQPTTYNPNSSAYRTKTTPTPKYTEIKRDEVKGKNNIQDFDKPKQFNKPTISSRKSQKTKLGPQESNFVNHNEFGEFSKVKLQQPQPFQAAEGKRVKNYTTTTTTKPANIEPQYIRTRGQQLSRVGTQEPAPFSTPQKSRGAPTPAAAANANVNPSRRGYPSRGSITYKATTQLNNGEDYTAITVNTRKSSTSAPREPAVTPTTFKPTTKGNIYEQFYYQPQQAQQRAAVNKAQKQTSTTSTSTPLSGTDNPYYSPYTNIDEDDGQYHPELYEADFPRNRFNLQRTTASSSPTSTTKAPTALVASKPAHHHFQHAQTHLKTQQQTSYQKEQEKSQTDDLSDEDELFRTAQSLNFGAASINKLRADIYKAEKTSQQYNSQYSPNPVQSSPKTSTTNSFSYSISTSDTTSKPQTTTYQTTTTTKRPTTTRASTTTTTTTTTTARSLKDHKDETKPSKSSKSTKNNKKDATKPKSKRPAHADPDTSYDYAYYDTDPLRDILQDDEEYEIKDFDKTR